MESLGLFNFGVVREFGLKYRQMESDLIDLKGTVNRTLSEINSRSDVS